MWDAIAILMQLILGNWVNFQLQVSLATENQLHKTVAKWQISNSDSVRQLFVPLLPVLQGDIMLEAQMLLVKERMQV